MTWQNNIIINRPCRRPFYNGFSYVEVLLASVILSVLLVSGLKLFANLGRSQQATADKEDVSFLVINMLEEIKTKAYKDPAAPDDALGLETGESSTPRSNYNDIDDYDNWSASPPENQDGQTYDRYRHFTRSVSLRYIKANNFTQSSAVDEGFKEVTITITRNMDNATIEKRTFVLANYERQ